MPGDSFSSPIKLDHDSEHEDNNVGMELLPPPLPPPPPPPFHPAMAYMIPPPVPRVEMPRPKGKQRDHTSYNEVEAVLASVQPLPDNIQQDPDFIPSPSLLVPVPASSRNTRGSIRMRSPSPVLERRIRARTSAPTTNNTVAIATSAEQTPAAHEQADEESLREAIRLSLASMHASRRGANHEANNFAIATSSRVTLEESETDARHRRQRHHLQERARRFAVREETPPPPYEP